MLVLGHRGSPRAARENTIASFRLALEQGADGVELDVRLTADHRLAVRHDDGFEGGSAVSALTLAHVREVEADLPTLDQVLDVLAGALTVVEMKSQGERNEPFADLVAAELARRTQRLTVSSFDPGLLALMRARMPSLRTALLVGRMLAGPSEVAWGAADAGHSELHVHHSILSGPDGNDVFAGAAGAGLDVVAWTVNDPDEAHALAGRGLAAVITDVPGVIRPGA